MAKNNHQFEIKRFTTQHGKNQYLLISRGEAAVIDASESYAEIGKIIDDQGIQLKYLLITHAHKPHLQALPDLKKNFGGMAKISLYGLNDVAIIQYMGMR